MRSKTILNVDFLKNLPARPGVLAKRSSFIINLAGIAAYSLIVFFLALDLPAQGSFTKTASLRQPAHLPINKSISRNQAGNQPASLEPAERVKSVQSVSLVEPANSGLPIRLSIPKIKVDAAIKHTGLTPLGAMYVPAVPLDVAWFKLGPRPGDNGSAVIAGHYGYWKNGQESVFNDLNKLNPGDKLSVKDEKGKTTTFIVRERKMYDKNADAKNVFNSNDGQPHLNLIACGGTWDKVTKNYSKRLVVFTDKE